MKILLTAINSKFIHSSLAIRYLKEYFNSNNPNSHIRIHISEYTINQHLDDIFFDIIKQNVDCVAFSCYIWNIDFVRNLVSNLKKVLPNLPIILGGPEVSYNYNILNEINADFIIIGEGEETFNKLVNTLSAYDDFSQIHGIVYKENSTMYRNQPIKFDFTSTIFPYTSNFDELENKIIYYESSRGCPFSCGYCMSSIEKGVSFLPIERVLQELQFFLNHKVKQVKFVDRTFNCNISHTKKIWSYLIKNTNSITNFHFEIAADLLTEELLEILRQAPEGLFQFEIGIQSTNNECLDAIKRKSDLTKLFAIVKQLKNFGNIHLHLDLIAGLPNENYTSFKNSFNDVYDLKPEQFQLGFLKLLHGSYLQVNAENFGIVYRDIAPYEVLSTKDISFDEILHLKGIETMLSVYYNSEHFKATLNYLEKFFHSYFDLYLQIWKYYENNNFHKLSHNKENTYKHLFEFASKIYNINKSLLSEVILFDMMTSENIKNLPSWLDLDTRQDEKINNFYHIPHYKIEQIDILNNLSSSKRRKKTNLFKFTYDFNTMKLRKIEKWTLFIYDKKTSIIYLDLGEKYE